MKIGIVGYQGCGKSSLFQWLTGVAPDPSLAHSTQSAAAVLSDRRVDELAAVYGSRKTTHAALTLVDTPGLDRSHEGNAARLAQIRETGCLAIVLDAAAHQPAQDLQSLEEDLLLTDWDIVRGRVERLRESVKKPRPNREQELAELAALQPLLSQLDAGQPLRGVQLQAAQQRAIKSFQLMTRKPRLLVVNTADDETNPERWLQSLPDEPRVAVPLRLVLELAALPNAERAAFCREMGLSPPSPNAVLHQMLHASGQFLFFTAGPKEARSWLIHRGATAEEAAASIHTDLARGFVRAETINCDDLLRLGSEREAKAQNMLRREPRDYQLQEGDVLHILASV